MSVLMVLPFCRGCVGGLVGRYVILVDGLGLAVRVSVRWPAWRLPVGCCETPGGCGPGTAARIWWLFSPRDGAGLRRDGGPQMFLRRFDLEHTFRFFKQTLGWTKPRIRTPAAADRWTWLVIGAHTQLRLEAVHQDHTTPNEPPDTQAKPSKKHSGQGWKETNSLNSR